MGRRDTKVNGRGYKTILDYIVVQEQHTKDITRIKVEHDEQLGENHKQVWYETKTKTKISPKRKKRRKACKIQKLNDMQVVREEYQYQIEK